MEGLGIHQENDVVYPRFGRLRFVGRAGVYILMALVRKGLDMSRICRCSFSDADMRFFAPALGEYVVLHNGSAYMAARTQC